MFEWAECQGPVDLYEDVYYPLVISSTMTFQMPSVSSLSLPMKQWYRVMVFLLLLLFVFCIFYILQLGLSVNLTDHIAKKNNFKRVCAPQYHAGIGKSLSRVLGSLGIGKWLNSSSSIWILSEQLDPSLPSKTIYRDGQHLIHNSS